MSLGELTTPQKTGTAMMNPQTTTIALYRSGLKFRRAKRGFLSPLSACRGLSLFGGALYPSRRRVASTHITKQDVRDRIMDKYDWTCQKCGATENLSIDHIIPVAKGGGNEDSNLQVLCRSCNSAKGASVDDE